MNIFTVEDISINLPHYTAEEQIALRLEGKVLARVDMKCDKHGNTFSTLKMSCEGSGFSESDVLRKAIQSLLNHSYYPNLELHAPICSCYPFSNKIHFDFSNLPKDFKKLFEDLFTDGNWNIPKTLNPSRTYIEDFRRCPL